MATVVVLTKYQEILHGTTLSSKGDNYKSFTSFGGPSCENKVKVSYSIAQYLYLSSAIHFPLRQTSTTKRHRDVSRKHPGMLKNIHAHLSIPVSKILILPDECTGTMKGERIAPSCFFFVGHRRVSLVSSTHLELACTAG